MNYQIIDLKENEVETFILKLENKEITNTKIRVTCKECGKTVEKWPDLRRIYNWLYCPTCSSRRTHIKKHGTIENYNEYIKEQRRKTCISKYGSFENAQKIRMEKQRKHNKTIYGCDYFFQTDEFKNKKEKTLTEMNEGVTTINVSQIKSIR